MSNAPQETLFEHKNKMWTYVIFMVLLVVAVLVINLVWSNPARAEHGVKHFLGLPSWAIASVIFVVGTLVYWLGMKVEPDWPEAIGALMMSGAIAAFELIVGWKHFDFGGLVVIPYLIPLAVFALLLMHAMKKAY